MFGKKGFIRTIEAVIAIILLLGIITYIFAGTPREIQKTPDIVESANIYIMNEILYNPVYRNCFIQATITGEGNKCDLAAMPGNCWQNIDSFIKKVVPPGYAYSCEICKTSKSCTNIPSLKDVSVYPKSGFILSDNKEGMIVRVYLYEIKT